MLRWLIFCVVLMLVRILSFSSWRRTRTATFRELMSVTDVIGWCSQCGAEALEDGDGHVLSACACLAPLTFEEDE